MEVEPKTSVLNLSSILDKFHNGETPEYELMCAILTGLVPVKPRQVTQILSQMHECVLQLDESMGKLIKSLLSVDWSCLEAEAMPIYSELIVAICGINPAFLPPSITTCVQRFLAITNEGDGCNILTNEADPSLALAHETLHRIAQVYPTAVIETSRIINDRWPFEGGKLELFVQYLRNVLVLYIHTRALRKSLMPILLDRLVKLDLTIGKASQVSQQTSAIFDMELPEGVSLGACECMDECLQYVMVMLADQCTKDRELALDTLEAITVHCENGNVANINVDNVPYIYLHFLSLDETWLPFFLRRLWKSSSTKMTCKWSQRKVSLMAALLARAQYATEKLVMSWLCEWVEWCESYCRYITSTCEGCVSHGLFYAVCQAILFLVTFRFNELMAKNPNGVRELNLERLTHGGLNPLRYCALHVVTAFANVSRSAQLVYCYHVIERNRRIFNIDNGLPQFTHDYLPLDPCKLPKCAKLLSNVYRCSSALLSQPSTSSPANRQRQVSEMELDFVVESMDDKNPAGLIEYANSPGFTFVMMS